MDDCREIIIRETISECVIRFFFFLIYATTDFYRMFVERTITTLPFCELIHGKRLYMYMKQFSKIWVFFVCVYIYIQGMPILIPQSSTVLHPKVHSSLIIWMNEIFIFISLYFLIQCTSLSIFYRLNPSFWDRTV